MDDKKSTQSTSLYSQDAIKKTLKYLGSFVREESNGWKLIRYFVFLDTEDNWTIYRIKGTRLVEQAPRFRRWRDFEIIFEPDGRAYSINNGEKKIFIKGSNKIIEEDLTTGDRKEIKRIKSTVIKKIQE